MPVQDITGNLSLRIKYLSKKLLELLSLEMMLKQWCSIWTAKTIKTYAKIAKNKD